LEQVTVAEPHHKRWLLLVDLALLLLLVGLIVAGAWIDDWHILAAVSRRVLLIAIIFVAWLALRSTARSRAYRNGYLDGRQMMIGSITEAMMRGMTPEEWVRVELERDQRIIEHI
jgi:hypothetical protein